MVTLVASFPGSIINIAAIHTKLIRTEVKPMRRGVYEWQGCSTNLRLNDFNSSLVTLSNDLVRPSETRAAVLANTWLRRKLLYLDRCTRSKNKPKKKKLGMPKRSINRINIM